MKRYLLPLLLLTAAITQTQRAASQSVTIRVATYNLLNFPNDLATRAAPISKVIAGVNPDILVVQELTNFTASLTLQLTLASLASSALVAAPQFDGPDTDNGMLYDSTKIEFVGHDTIHTLPRYTDVWTVVVRGTRDTIDIYGTHLKDGDTQEDRQERAEAIGRIILRGFKSSHHRLLAGDLNLYSASEPAYKGFSDSPRASYFFDPIGQAWHADV